MNSKQIRLFGWLESVASKTPTGLDDAYNPYKDKVYCRFGRFYATNGYMVACVEFPEYANAGEYVWKTAKMDLCDVKFRDVDRSMNDDDVFERFFPKPTEYGTPDGMLLTPSLITQALRGFHVMRMKPLVQPAGYRVMLSAHDKDAAIKAVCMVAKQV